MEEDELKPFEKVTDKEKALAIVGGWVEGIAETEAITCDVLHAYDDRYYYMYYDRTTKESLQELCVSDEVFEAVSDYLHEQGDKGLIVQTFCSVWQHPSKAMEE